MSCCSHKHHHHIPTKTGICPVIQISDYKLLSEMLWVIGFTSNSSARIASISSSSSSSSSSASSSASYNGNHVNDSFFLFMMKRYNYCWLLQLHFENKLLFYIAIYVCISAKHAFHIAITQTLSSWNILAYDLPLTAQ